MHTRGVGVAFVSECCGVHASFLNDCVLFVSGAVHFTSYGHVNCSVLHCKRVTDQFSYVADVAGKQSQSPGCPGEARSRTASLSIHHRFIFTASPPILSAGTSGTTQLLRNTLEDASKKKAYEQ